MSGVGADGFPVQLPDEVRGGQAAHLQQTIKVSECVNACLQCSVWENEYMSCMCCVGGQCVFIGSVWLICLSCVCLEEPGRLRALSWE